jgi:hypothetical protein
VKLRWVKQGRIIEAAGQAPWIGTHAALPAVDLDGDRCRIYFSSRDRQNRSQIGFCDLLLAAEPKVRAFGQQPVLLPGALGTFDDAGVTSSCVLRHQGRFYLYYTGWSLGVSVPFYLHVGLAISDDGQTFERYSPAPLLDRTSVDPYLTASPWVLRNGTTWQMWYVSGTAWEATAAQPRHRYHIRYAESADGIRWNRKGQVCIDYASPEEYAFGRPCVIHDEDGYRMWFSCRGDRYRIGYAESNDGITWARNDSEAGIVPSPTGWDSEMITYPVVFRHGDRWHMLYNGNDYGRTGIGFASGT